MPPVSDLLLQYYRKAALESIGPPQPSALNHANFTQSEEYGEQGPVRPVHLTFEMGSSRNLGLVERMNVLTPCYSSLPDVPNLVIESRYTHYEAI